MYIRAMHKVGTCSAVTTQVLVCSLVSHLLLKDCTSADRHSAEPSTFFNKGLVIQYISSAISQSHPQPPPPPNTHLINYLPATVWGWGRQQQPLSHHTPTPTPRARSAPARRTACTACRTAVCHPACTAADVRLGGGHDAADHEGAQGADARHEARAATNNAVTAHTPVLLLRWHGLRVASTCWQLVGCVVHAGAGADAADIVR